MDKYVMERSEKEEANMETIELLSDHLERNVRVDFYMTRATASSRKWNLLLVNDGQDLDTMNFGSILSSLDDKASLGPVLIAGIHCGEDRKNEYGMSAAPDYLGRGARAVQYERFILSELLPLIMDRFRYIQWEEKIFAGFSLGGLSALDIAWRNADIFSRVGVFSGSLWWRSVDKNDKRYNGSIHRMMHQQIKLGEYHEGMKFFFECGEQDEWEDRNKNGIIDSIDDTIDLMRELVRKGYKEGRDIRYLQLADGKHDVVSWSRALPAFLKWAFEVN